ncbi:MAG: HEPN domain-containing protein [Deltaproteobacteria bacterium]|nr:HEPN domain-containing protein [Deltaproteobacteria bacterium]
MKDKALANFDAARLLTGHSFHDSAASRAYYAAYLMAWHFLQKMEYNPRHKTKDGQYYWRHDLFPQIMCDGKFINPTQMDEWEWLYYLRIKADYYREHIEENEVKKSIQITEQFIEYFLNEEKRIE